MNDDLHIPNEGLTTLGANFTHDALAKMKKSVLTLRAQGKKERDILEQMKKDLPDFSPAMRKRIYDLAAGNPIADDFTKNEVLGHTATKKDTIELWLGKPRPDLVSGMLVHYLGADWYVSRMFATGDKFILRKLS